MSAFDIMANSSIVFHTGENPTELLPSTETFGKLAIELKAMEIAKTPLYLKITLDVSDSMDLIESSEGHRHMNRLDYAKETLKNMLNGLIGFIGDGHEITLHLDTFSDIFKTVIEDTVLSNENVQTIVKDIYKIRTSGMTDLELAIKKSTKIIDDFTQANENYKVLHILLTDGEPTCGTSSVSQLEQMVSNKYPCAFIGYGVHHKAHLLQSLSKTHISHKYLFVDNYAKTGVIYGELIYNMMNTTLQNISISMVNGYIYDSQNNKWEDSIQIYNMVSQKEYIYHIKTSESVESVSAMILGTIMTDQSKFVWNQLYDKQEDLSKYIFRQRTMELLYEASKDSDNAAERQLKTKLKNFFDELRQYMRNNNLESDSFMKVLCDDIYFSYNTIGTIQGHMLSMSRNTSQREQSYYRATSDTIQTQPLNYMRMPPIPLARQTNHHDDEPFDILENSINIDRTIDDLTEIDTYVPNNTDDDTYINQDTIRFIRAISS